MRKISLFFLILQFVLLHYPVFIQQTREQTILNNMPVKAIDSKTRLNISCSYLVDCTLDIYFVNSTANYVFSELELLTYRCP